jgi:dTDP-D-glucose 4,6-dehydratase
MGNYSEELQALEQALETLSKAKPNDRSEKDRRYAVTITELEKVIAWFKVYVEFAG